MNHLESALTDNKKGQKLFICIFILVVTFVGASIIGSFPLIIAVAVKTAQEGLGFGFDPSDPSTLGLSSNWVFALMVFPLVLAFFMLVIFIKLIDKKSIQQIINGTSKIRWRRYFVGAGVWTCLMIISLGISYLLNPSVFILQFNISSFIPLLILSFLFLPFQTAFEELAFRGYLAQGIVAFTGSRWLALIIPSVLFGLLHIANPEVKEFGFAIMMPQYILMGLMFGLISIFDDGIELAMGIHAANNIFISLFMTHPSSAFQTAAVFRVTEVDPVSGLIEIIVFGGIILAVFYKLYGWKFSVMKEKVEGDKSLAVATEDDI